MEGFFYQCRAIDSAAELKEFVYRTYQGAVRDILRSPWRDAAELIQAGRERTNKDRFWLMYCNIYPYMTDDTFIEFEKWYDGLKPKAQGEKITTDKIISNVSDIINMTLGGQNVITV